MINAAQLIFKKKSNTQAVVLCFFHRYHTQLDEKKTKKRKRSDIGSELTSLRIKKRRLEMAVSRLEADSERKSYEAATSSFEDMKRLIDSANKDRETIKSKRLEIDNINKFIKSKQN